MIVCFGKISEAHDVGIGVKFNLLLRDGGLPGVLGVEDVIKFFELHQELA